MLKKTRDVSMARVVVWLFRFVLLLAVVPCLAQRSDSPFVPKTFSGTQSRTMPYRLFIPKGYVDTKKYPLVLWLHGAAGRGNDNWGNISKGNELGAHVWTLAKNQASHPCVVVAPQCPDTTLWVSNDGLGYPPDELDIVIDLLKNLRETYSIDTNRMYVAGQSMGGVATWEIISRYPKMFAAALPLCGIGNVRKAPGLTGVALWAFHGDADDIVPVVQTREMVAAVRAAGGQPKYTEYKGIGHDVWNSAFKERDLVDWVFRQHRNE